MCLIIKKPAHRRIATDFLANAWKRNSHGWGSFYLDAGQVVWARGMKFDELVAHNAGLPVEAEVYIHVRRATYGHVSEGMAHPYRVREGLMLMHNGSIHHLAPDDAARSDTHELARLLHDLLDGLSDAQAAALIRSQGFARLTAPLIQGSMVILLDRQGPVQLGRAWHVVQSHEWDGVMPGIEVSNTHAWLPKGAWELPSWRPLLRGLQALWGARTGRSVA